MRFDFAQLRAVLLPEPAGLAGYSEDWPDGEALIPAAVLFPIVERATGHTVLLTQRNPHLRDHPGQISFPGGRIEALDPSPLHAALREAEEEVGLSSDCVVPLGYLPEYRTGTGFQVTPVVGLVRPPFEARLDPFEVAEVFEVPLSFLLDPANHKRHALYYRGAMREFYAMPYGDYFIWGATAGMIRLLYERLLSSSVGCEPQGGVLA